MYNQKDDALPEMIPKVERVVFESRLEREPFCMVVVLVGVGLELRYETYCKISKV